MTDNRLIQLMVSTVRDAPPETAEGLLTEIVAGALFMARVNGMAVTGIVNNAKAIAMMAEQRAA